MDLVTLVSLVYGLLGMGFGAILGFRSPSKRTAFPLFVALGGGMDMFLSLMAVSVLLQPVSTFAIYTARNLLIGAAVGVWVYICAAKLVKMMWGRTESRGNSGL